MMDSLGAWEKLKGMFYVEVQSTYGAGIGARIESWEGAERSRNDRRVHLNS